MPGKHDGQKKVSGISVVRCRESIVLIQVCFCDQIHSKILFVKRENDVMIFVMIFITRFITRFITLKMSNMKASDELAIVFRRPQGLKTLVLDNKRSDRSSAIIWLLNPP